MIPMKSMELESPDPVVRKDAAQFFRRVLSVDQDPPIDDCVAAGAVMRLVHLLDNPHFPSIQFDAAWALTNIASGTSENTQVVLDAGALQRFVMLLASPSAEVREQAVWGLGNIAGDCVALRDRVLDAGALPGVLQLLNSAVSNLSTLRNAAWTLSNLCRWDQSEAHLMRILPALPHIAQLLYHDDEDTLVDACWALSYLSDGNDKHIDAVVRLQVCERLVTILRMHHDYRRAKVPALRSLGNIITGSDDQTEVATAAGAVPALVALLRDEKRLVRKEAAWALSNVLAGTKHQLQLVFDHHGIQELLARLQEDHVQVQQEAAWAISNALLGGDDKHVDFLVQQRTIEIMCGVLQGKPTAGIITVIVEALDRILEVGATLAEMHGVVNPYRSRAEPFLQVFIDLQDLENDKVYTAVANLLNTHFDDMVAEDANDDEDDDEDDEDDDLFGDGDMGGTDPSTAAPGQPQFSSFR